MELNEHANQLAASMPPVRALGPDPLISPWRIYEAPRFGIGALADHMRETWGYRSLVVVLVLRELKARYRGSLLGFGWSLLNPLVLLAVYSLLFGIYMRINIDHYPLYLLAGLLPWLWLAQTLTMGAGSLVDSGMLVSKVMLPPQLLPIVGVLANGINFLLALPVLLVFALFTKGVSPAALLGLPVVVLAQTALLVGLTLPLAATCVLFRDIKFLVSNLTTFWFFLTPIVYTADFVPERLRIFLMLNPFYPFAKAYQSILYRGEWPSVASMLAIAGITIAALTFGILLFERIRTRAVEEL